MTATVTREQADSYFINVRDEQGQYRGWARIFVQSGLRSKARPEDTDTWWVYVAVISDWGNFGHLWSHCGSPPEDFLFDLERSYAMGKFLGDKLNQYDGEGTLAEVRRWLLELRREGDIDKEQAREVWDHIEDNSSEIESGIHEMVRAMESMPLSARLRPCEPWELARKRINPQAEDFWRWAWPPFIEALQERATAGSAV